MENENLVDWYQSLNEEEGIAKITVPVLQPDNPPEGDAGEVEVPTITKPEDPVVQKDKINSLGTFVMAKRIQDLLVRIAGLTDPYEQDSEERQGLVDKVKDLYIKLGDNIGKL